MSYDEEQQRRSRVVVETPTARREVYQTQTTRYPERSGYSTGTVAAVALTAMALTAIVFLFLMTRGDSTTEVNVNAQATPYPQTPLAAQPVLQPTPFVAPTPLPMTTPLTPVVITPPAGTTATTTVPGAAPAPVVTQTPNVPDDTALQNTVSKRIQDDPDLSTTDIIATVPDGKATPTGTVNAPDLKRRAERVALSVRGVRRVENQIAVEASPDAEPTTP